PPSAFTEPARCHAHAIHCAILLVGSSGPSRDDRSSTVDTDCRTQPILHYRSHRRCVRMPRLLMRVFVIVIFAVAPALVGCDDRSPKQPAGQSANTPKTAASADQTGDGVLPPGTYVGVM